MIASASCYKAAYGSFMKLGYSGNYGKSGGKVKGTEVKFESKQIQKIPLSTFT